MKKMRLMFVVFMSGVSAAVAAPTQVSDEFLIAFFNRDANHLAQTFAPTLKRKDVGVLGQVYKMLQEEDASILQPVFASNGFIMNAADLRGAIADARALRVIGDITARETASEKTSELERRAKANRDRIAAEIAAAANQSGGSIFDGSEKTGLTVTGIFGGGTQGDKGVKSRGLMIGMPLLARKLNNVGLEFGAIATERDDSYDQDLGSKTNYQSEDGEYRVTESTTRKITDKVNLLSLVGVNYHIPLLKHNGAKIVKLETGARLGVGSADQRILTKTKESEELTVDSIDCSTSYDDAGYSHTTCHDAPYWKSVSTSEKQTTEGAAQIKKMFYTAFIAANVAISNSLSLRLEIERYFLDQLNTADATVSRVGLQYKF